MKQAQIKQKIEQRTLGAMRDIPFMGVIYVVDEAMKLGFWNGNPDWCNLGQGQPEVGEMEGAPPRISEIKFEPQDHAYGHIGGTTELREVVADYYNRLYRRGKKEKYTAANVGIASGGRLALTRLFASLGDVNLGYQIPDYTAYEDMMSYHQHRLTPIVIPALERDGFKIPPAALEAETVNRGIEAFVVSNPCNPTGRVIQGDELKQYIKIANKYKTTLILDEFYSHFIYRKDGAPASGPISGAAYVEEVNNEPVLLVDGLTKSFRYPGWRIGWVVGPASMIETLDRAGSAIDGGPSRPMQRAAIRALEEKQADQETMAVRNVFSRKRNLMLKRLREMGINCPIDCESTFYIWGSIENLPAPLNDGMTFFHEGLKHKVMTVPGVFFDVNPGRRRKNISNYKSWIRFSFGSPEDNVNLGLDRLEAMIKAAKK
jgi:aspartate/methionine/tyrosine aminotransferase